MRFADRRRRSAAGPDAAAVSGGQRGELGLGGEPAQGVHPQDASGRGQEHSVDDGVAGQSLQGAWVEKTTV